AGAIPTCGCPILLSPLSLLIPSHARLPIEATAYHAAIRLRPSCRRRSPLSLYVANATLCPRVVPSFPQGSRKPKEAAMRSAQPPESWADLAGAVDSHPSLRAAMKNLSGLSRTSTWTMRASRARSHRSSLSASIHEESIHIMLRHLKMSKDVTMQRKNLSSVLLALVERHQRYFVLCQSATCIFNLLWTFLYRIF
uniref:Uncharacterized protein n=6 Tax=Aegilops tauschii subsp. strangulata TaxID=200361 RepID=A0A453SLJ6_AEGTS